MKIDEILGTTPTPTPTPQEDTPAPREAGSMRLEDVLKIQAQPKPIERKVTNEDNTIKPDVNVTPTYSKTKQVQMSGKLLWDSLVGGAWGLPENTKTGITSLIEGVTKLTKYTDPQFYVDQVTGGDKAEQSKNERLAVAKKLTTAINDNTEFLKTWEQMGQDYQTAEDAGVPEDFRNSLKGQIASGVGGSVPFLASLFLTRGLGMSAELAGAGSKAGEVLGFLAKTSQKLGIPLNTLAESGQLKEQTVQELLDQGKSKEEADRIGTNVFGVSVIATPALDAIGLFNPNIKRTVVKKLAQFGIDVGAEVAQENVQQSAQNVATGKGIFEGAQNTSIVAGITSTIFSLISHGHLQIKGAQGEPTPAPTPNPDGTVPEADPTATPTVGDIILNGKENYTPEQQVEALKNADLDSNLVDPSNQPVEGTPEHEALKQDISDAIKEGASAGEVSQYLVDNLSVSPEYAQNIVAQIISSQQTKDTVEAIKNAPDLAVAPIKEDKKTVKEQAKMAKETASAVNKANKTPRVKVDENSIIRIKTTVDETKLPKEIKAYAKNTVESDSGNTAVLANLPVSLFKSAKFETLNQDVYTKGERKITEPIAVSYDVAKKKYVITDGANRTSQARANGDETIPAVVEIIDSKRDYVSVLDEKPVEEKPSKKEEKSQVPTKNRTKPHKNIKKAKEDVKKAVTKATELRAKDTSTEEYKTANESTAQLIADTYWDNKIAPAVEKGEAIVIGADDLKDFFGNDYNDKNHPSYSRGAFLLYERALKEDTTGEVIFTGGGASSGKTELVVKSLVDKGFKGIIYDSNMANFDGISKQIKMAEEADKAIQIYGVIPNLESARIFSIQRENRIGRGISDATFARGHAGFPAVTAKLLQENIISEDQVKILDTRNVKDFREAVDMVASSDYAHSPLDLLKGLGYNEEEIKKTYAKENYNTSTGQRNNSQDTGERSSTPSGENRTDTKDKTRGARELPRQEVPTGVKLPEESEARRFAMDNVQFYFEDIPPEFVMIPDRNSMDYSAVYRTKSNIPEHLPSHLRNRAVFNRLLPYWLKQERPKVGKNMQELYDLLQKDVTDMEKQYVPHTPSSELLPDGTFFKEKATTEQVLVTHHNLTEKNLLHADKLGGLPVPSIAISNYKMATDSFGDITLIASKDLIDPKIKSNKAFNSDSYSARYPKINYYVDNKKALDEDFKKVKEYFTDPEVIRSYETGHYVLSESVGDYGVEGLYRSTGVGAMFAMEKGLNKNSDRNEINVFVSQNRDEFEKFADNLAEKIGIESSIYNGYTASGNRRSGLPHTLENLVKKMKGSGRTDENFNYGVGSLRSAVAKKFKSIPEIQKDSHKLISEEEMTKIKDQTSQQFSDLMEKHNVNDYFRFADNIVDYELGKISASQLKQYTGIDDTAVQEFEDFGKYLANLPSEYFEVKMQRAVGLNEFNVAIVPDTISPEAEEILVKNGIIVHKFNKEKNNRNEVIARAVADNALLFKEKRNMDLHQAVDESMAYDETTHPEMMVLEDFKRRYKVDVDTYLVDKILTGKASLFDPRKMGQAHGVANNSIAIARDAVVNTAKHELIHLTLNNLDVIPEFRGFDKNVILEEQASKMGLEFDPNRNAVAIEEQLAVDFEEYVNKNYIPKSDILGRFFKFIKDTIDGFRNLITATQGSVITDYYDAVLYGKTGRTNNVQIQNLGEINKYIIDNVVDFSPKYAVRELTVSNGITSMKLREDGDKKQNEFTAMQKAVVEAYVESSALTTKILMDLQGKTIVSKQYILDATNRAEIKQVEKDIVKQVLADEGDKVNVKDFADKVKEQLLPLSIKSSDNVVPNEDNDYNPFTMNEEGAYTPMYDNVSLPEDLRGEVAGYVENIYESPIETEAGAKHFRYHTDNYFGHTRLEDMSDDVRRVIEVQSDLYQKDNLEKEIPQYLRTEDYLPTEKLKEFNSISARITDLETAVNAKDLVDEVKDLRARYKALFEEAQAYKKETVANRTLEVAKLAQYENPTAHFRMVREEVRKATLDGKKRVLFPTGDTAMMIEGLAGRGNDNFITYDDSTPLKPSEVARGFKFNDQRHRNLRYSNFIITEKTGKDTFKAMPLTDKSPSILGEHLYDVDETEYNTALDEYEKANKGLIEEFSMAEKIDDTNPIHKFYEKTLAKYLKNNYNAVPVTDEKGVTWYEVTIKPEYSGAVTAFKEKVPEDDNKKVTKILFPRFTAMKQAKTVKVLGEQRISKAYSRVKDRLAEQYQNDVTYTSIKIHDETAKAMEVIKQNPEYAKKVALGLELPPIDVTDTAIAIAVAEKAREDKDYQTQADAEKERSLRQTRRGQEIVMERGRVDENSPAYFIKQVLDRRKELIAQNFKPFMRTPKPFMKVLDDTIETKVRKNKRIKSDLELKIEDLDSFLNAIAC